MRHEASRRRQRAGGGGRGPALALALLLGAGGSPLLGAAGAAPPATRVGTLETLAGPGFCPAGAVRDPESATVRALATDGSGRIYFDTGPAAAGLVGKVRADGDAGLLRTGLPAPPGPAGEQGTSRPGAAVAGRLVADGQGGVIVASGARLVRISTVESGGFEAQQGASTIAGDPAAPPGAEGPSSSGDGGPAVAARFRSVRSLAADESGNLYVSDEIDRSLGTVRIRFINRGQPPVTFYAGTPQAMTVGPGEIATIAGRAGPVAAGDGGPATLATIQGVPPSLAVSGSRLYVASYRAVPGAQGGAVLRVINLGSAPILAQGREVAPGAVDTVARGRPAAQPGHGGAGGMGGMGGARGGAAGAEQFGYVPGMAADASGNVLIADEMHNRVRLISAAGGIATVAGGRPGSPGGFNGNDRPALEATLDRPFDVKLGPDGRPYIADQLNEQVRYIDAAGLIHAAQGSQVGLGWNCEGGASRPQPGGPLGVAVDGRGRVYVVAATLHLVLRIDANGAVTRVAGVGRRDPSCRSGPGCAGFSGDGGPADQARLDSPVAIATTPRGDLYILDAGNLRVRFVNLGEAAVTANGVSVGPGAIATVAGGGEAGSGGDGASALRAQLAAVPELDSAYGLAAGQAHSFGVVLPRLAMQGLAADGEGDLFIADARNHRVRLVDPRGTISTLVGEGAPAGRGDCCRDPVALALDGAGNLYVADGATAPTATPQPRIWAINRGPRATSLLGQMAPPGHPVLVAGSGRTGLAGDGGSALGADLELPTGLAADRRGDLFLAGVSGDLFEGAPLGEIRRIDAQGTISTAAGGGAFGFNGDGLHGRFARLNLPAGLAVDGQGNLLVADLANDRVRRLDLAPPLPLAATSSAEEGGGGPPLLALAVGAAAVLGVAGLVRRRRLAR